ncbi:MAG: hypothetical protein HUJ72_02150, partial [Blautia sp.]|nr:hypothetical protein [Blautia sp.]
VQYLSMLEGRSTDEINQSIRNTNKSIRLKLLEQDEAMVWQAFSDAVIMGDSRTVGFSYHEFIPSSRCMAEGGGMIIDVPKYYDQLLAQNPSEVYLNYGMNDVGLGEWPDANGYAEVYAKEVENLQKVLPDAEIYVESILPAVGVGLQADPDYPRIGEYNEALKEMCENRGYHFIDNTPVAEAHQDWYQEDGLHVQKEFYIFWAMNMLVEVLES